MCVTRDGRGERGEFVSTISVISCDALTRSAGETSNQVRIKTTVLLAKLDEDVGGQKQAEKW